MLARGLAAVATALTASAAVGTGYLLFLTLAAVARKPALPADVPAARRFGILVPAHNEEAVLGRLLASLARLDYPPSRYVVIVVADNCDDQTAALARDMGARVYERHAPTLRGKGYALRWALDRLRAGDETFDAYVVLDADSSVTPNLLRRMEARLAAGSLVVQAYYSVLNPADSPVAALRYAALTAVHYLRPRGRAALGLSCGLKGNGMCFAAAVLERFGWQWYTLAEDVEFHLALARAGIRVDFAPETVVLAEMPVSFLQATSQNARWEGGRLQLLRHQVPALLRDGLRQRSMLRLDAAIEQCLPPLSIPFALGGAGLGVGLVLAAPVLIVLASLTLSGQVVYLLASLRLVRAPRYVYAALPYAPLYIGWKLGLYLRALVRTRATRWVRTTRVVPARGDTRLPPCD